MKEQKQTEKNIKEKKVPKMFVFFFKSQMTIYCARGEEITGEGGEGRDPGEKKRQIKQSREREGSGDGPVAQRFMLQQRKQKLNTRG